MVYVRLQHEKLRKRGGGGQTNRISYSKRWRYHECIFNPKNPQSTQRWTEKLIQNGAEHVMQCRWNHFKRHSQYINTEACSGIQVEDNGNQFSSHVVTVDSFRVVRKSLIRLVTTFSRTVLPARMVRYMKVPKMTVNTVQVMQCLTYFKKIERKTRLWWWPVEEIHARERI